MNSHFRYGLIFGILCLGVMILLYLIDNSWMIKYSKLLAYFILLIAMVKATSAPKMNTFSDVFKTSWLTFVVGSTLFHIGLFLVMNYVDTSLYDLTSQIAEEYISKNDTAQEIVQEVPVSKFRELTFPLVLSFIIPGTVLAVIVSVIKNRNTLID